MVIGSGLKDKLMGFIRGAGEREDPVIESVELDDYETRDKVLKGLRRMRRRQMDVVEKERLREDINRFNRRKASKDFVGLSLFDEKVTGLKGLKKGKGVGKQRLFAKSPFFSKGFK